MLENSELCIGRTGRGFQAVRVGLSSSRLPAALLGPYFAKGSEVSVEGEPVAHIHRGVQPSRSMLLQHL